MICKGKDYCDRDLDPVLTFPVLEIFRSIQGEGSHIGQVVTFIRLAGCNLRCPWCDTKGSWNAEGEQKTLLDILGEVEPGDPVVITGGEPTIHKELVELVSALHEQGCYVMLETNGTNNVPWNVDWITCSPKPPLYDIHPQLHPDELKYVVTDDFDARTAIPEEIRRIYEGVIWLQPDGTNAQTMEHAWSKCYQLVQKDDRLRVGVQLHKLMEVQ
jgi:7-carboxy-7-deazaguanine synthase